MELFAEGNVPSFRPPPPLSTKPEVGQGHILPQFTLGAFCFSFGLVCEALFAARRCLARKRTALDADPYPMRLAWWPLLVPGAGLDLRTAGIYRIGRDPLDPVNYVVPWELSMTHCAARPTSNFV